MSTLPSRRLTPEEYLEIERRAQVKSEYYNGEMFAMAGARWAHNLVVGNTFAELRQQLRTRPCAVTPSDMRVQVQATGLYTYPDVVVVCGEPLFKDDQRDTLLNPTVIVEVLSKSTEGYDRGKKFVHYRRIDSLREYVLVSQDRVCVEQYTLQEDRWVLAEWNRRDDVLRLTSVGCEISLRDLYAKVQVPEGEPRADTGHEG